MEYTVSIIGLESTHTVSRNGEVKNIITGKVMMPYIWGEYKNISMHANGKTYRMLLHRLLAIHFIDNPCNHPIVHHRDGNKMNNDLDNLEWTTYRYNLQHAYDSGLRKRVWGDDRRKWVLNTETGIYYHGVQEALESLSRKGTLNRLRDALNGYRKNKTKFIYA